MAIASRTREISAATFRPRVQFICSPVVMVSTARTGTASGRAITWFGHHLDLLLEAGGGSVTGIAPARRRRTAKARPARVGR